MHRRPSPQSPAKADPHRRCLSPHCTGAGLVTRRFVVGVIQRPSRCRTNPGIRGTCAASCADLSADAKPIVMRLRAQAALAKVVHASHSPHRGAGAPVSLQQVRLPGPKGIAGESARPVPSASSPSSKAHGRTRIWTEVLSPGGGFFRVRPMWERGGDVSRRSTVSASRRAMAQRSDNSVPLLHRPKHKPGSSGSGTTGALQGW